MDSLKKKGIINIPKARDVNSMVMDQICRNPSCFFCIMKERDPSLRRAGLAACFKEMPPIGDDDQHVLVLSGLWNIAMAQPDDPEFPSLGIFDCMASFLDKGINDRNWLLRDQNIYIPYYAAHVIGSYTMNKVEFAEKAVLEGVIPPLMELLRGNMSWVEQRVAVRALGHLASYERTFEAVAAYEEEVVRLTMHLASTCLDEVYVKFVGVKRKSKRPKYHCDLLTRGVGGSEMENRKAEEWASQLQCWSLYLLNCFACKEKSLNLICKPEFLADLCGMWGGLVNHSSPAGVGLIRILCYSKRGRQNISESKESLMDCIVFINGSINSDTNKRVKIPYYAASMISKQMDATWLFANARSKATIDHHAKLVHESEDDYEMSSNEDHQKECDEMMSMMMMEKKSIASGLSCIIEEPLIVRERRSRRRNKAVKAMTLSISKWGGPLDHVVEKMFTNERGKQYQAKRREKPTWLPLPLLLSAVCRRFHGVNEDAIAKSDI
ncbi:Cytochrome P450 [Hibiscus syriacus]|uniref:Cytochrome P450 n=1 Tax=Hibiscus syriacus TaxID=106335 RepID=A0A6A3CWI2_HIBSY|nr:Cytochrome P450 [Hibiscus syriacus]